MADIIINGPEGQSTINNIPAWATEATQKTIADSLKGIGSSADKIEALLQLQSKGIKQLVKTGKEGDKELADLFERVNKDNNKHATSQTKQSKAATDTINNGLDQLTKIQSDGVNQLSQLNKETAQQNKDLDKILDQLNDSGSGLMSFASGGSKIFGALGLVLDGLIGGIKILGGVILSVASYIGKEFMDTFNILNNSLKQGTGGIIGLTQGVDNVATAANLAGMSLEEFADFAAANSKILRTLSASGFADLYSKTLLASNGLLDLGMTADDAVESVMNELEYRRRFGIVLSQSTLELQSGLIRSARELRVFANAVGISEADLRQQAEIQEQHIDLMAGQAKAMGKNESEMENMINAAQRTSRVLAAIGGEDLINPLFESISKGATGLSDEFVEMGQVLPELLVMVGNESANFLQNGEMSANLGYDIMMMMRNLSDEQQATINNMQRAGIGGAATIQQMQKNANRLTNEMINAMRLEPDEERQSLLRTFNSLGFVVNQATSSIGDFGKTALLSMLGFSKAEDGMYDVTQGIEAMSESILDLTSNIFGRNSDVYDVVADFMSYIKLMTGADTDADDLEAARKKFSSNINGLAENIGDGLRKALEKGTFIQTLSDFFRSFVDELMMGIYDATGGILFKNSAHEIQARRFVKGDIGASEFGLHAGDLSGTEREKTSQIMFGGIVEEAKRLNISEDDINKMIPLSRGVAFKEQTAFNQKRAVGAMNNFQDGFQEMFESYFEGYGTNFDYREDVDKVQADKVLAMLEERIKLVQAFNDSSKDTVFDFVDQADALGLDFKTGQLMRQNYTSDMNNVLEDINNGTLILDNDVDEDNSAEANRVLNRLQEIYDANLGQTNLRASGFDVQSYGLNVDRFKTMMNNKDLNFSEYYKDLKGDDYKTFMESADMKSYGQKEYNELLKTTLEKMMSSDTEEGGGNAVLTNTEFNELRSGINALRDTNLSKELLNNLMELITTQKSLTGAIIQDNSG